MILHKTILLPAIFLIAFSTAFASAPILDLPTDPRVPVILKAGFGDSGHHTGAQHFAIDGDLAAGTAVIAPFDGFVVYQRYANGGLSVKNVPLNSVIPASTAVAGASVVRDDLINSVNAVWTLTMTNAQGVPIFSVAHLSEQSLLPNQPQEPGGVGPQWKSEKFQVSRGMLIARTGGDRSLPGRGFSSGPHFHLQTISDGLRPFSQSSDFSFHVRILDSSNQWQDLTLTDSQLNAGSLYNGTVYGIPQTAFTPLPTLNWEFNTTGNFEGWNPVNVSGAAVHDGILFIDPSGTDPYIVGPSVSFDASRYPFVELRMANNGLDGNSAIYFRTQSADFSEDKQVHFTSNNCSLCGNAPFFSYSVPMTSNSQWTGTITGIRLDPALNGQAGTAADSMGIDYIRLTPAEGDFVFIASSPDPNALNVGCVTLADQPVSLSQNVALTTSISGGQAPFQVQWSGIVNSVGTNASFTTTSPGTVYATTTVKDSSQPAQQQQATCSVDVSTDNVVSNPTFQATATVSPASPNVGQSAVVTLNLTNTSNGSANGILVDPEIYANGQQIFQQPAYTNQFFAMSETRSFSFSFVPQSTAQYTVKAGEFDGNWHLFDWQDSVLIFSTSAQGGGGNLSSAPLNIWWPSDGVTVSGIQPFKARLENIPLSSYGMVWTVDSGQPNPMNDSPTGGDHKEATVDLSGWNWRDSGDRWGPFSITFIVKDPSGAAVQQKTVTIYVSK